MKIFFYIININHYFLNISFADLAKKAWVFKDKGKNRALAGPTCYYKPSGGSGPRLSYSQR